LKNNGQKTACIIIVYLISATFACFPAAAKDKASEWVTINDTEINFYEDFSQIEYLLKNKIDTVTKKDKADNIFEFAAKHMHNDFEEDGLVNNGWQLLKGEHLTHDGTAHYNIGLKGCAVVHFKGTGFRYYGPDGGLPAQHGFTMDAEILIDGILAKKGLANGYEEKDNNSYNWATSMLFEITGLDDTEHTAIIKSGDKGGVVVDYVEYLASVGEEIPDTDDVTQPPPDDYPAPATEKTEQEQPVPRTLDYAHMIAFTAFIGGVFFGLFKNDRDKYS